MPKYPLFPLHIKLCSASRPNSQSVCLWRIGLLSFIQVIRHLSFDASSGWWIYQFLPKIQAEGVGASVFFRFDSIFFFRIAGSEKKCSWKKSDRIWGNTIKKNLLLTDLESPDRFQIDYFKGKTEENMQCTSKFSPAARWESLFIFYIVSQSQRLGMGIARRAKKNGGKTVCWMGGFARRAKKISRDFHFFSFLEN